MIKITQRKKTIGKGTKILNVSLGGWDYEKFNIFLLIFCEYEYFKM